MKIFFLQTAVAAREREGSFIYSQFHLGIGIAVFLPDCPLALGVPLSLPSSEALLPHAASKEVITALPEFLLALL